MPRKKRRPSKRPPAPKPASESPRAGSEGKGSQPRKASGWRRVGVWLVWVLGAACAAGLAALALLYPGSAGPGGGRDVALDVVGDESPEALAARLEAAGLVKRPGLFAFYVRLTGAAGNVARGTHILPDNLTPRELLERLERSPYAGRVRVTFPEGFTRFDIARRLQERHVCWGRDFLTAVASPALLHELHADGDSLEGFLFPATYDFAADSDPTDVARKLKAEFDRRWAALEERHASG